MLHTNVGLSNGATGAINAATDRVPMLLMSGRTPTVEEGRFGARTVPIGWGQEMRDQPALVREACKWDYELRFPEQVPQLLDRAHAIATSTPQGPVYLAPAARGAVRTVPERRARSCAGHGRGAGRRAALAVDRRRWSARRSAPAARDRPARRGRRGGIRRARPAHRSVVDPGVSVLGGRHCDLRPPPDVRRAGSGALDLAGRRRARHRQPGAVVARHPSPPGGLSGDPPRPGPARGPLPRAQLPVRPVGHLGGRPRAGGSRTSAERVLPSRVRSQRGRSGAGSSSDTSPTAGSVSTVSLPPIPPGR